MISPAHPARLFFSPAARLRTWSAVGWLARACRRTTALQPDGAACITWAASLPDVRGSGAGIALTEAALA
jgi:hypothetical protein